MPRTTPNTHKVPKKQWAKWSEQARRVFNRVMHAMRPSMQWAFRHPKAAAIAREQWQTTRWNAAWTAADASDGAAPSIIFEVHRGETVIRGPWGRPLKARLAKVG